MIKNMEKVKKIKKWNENSIMEKLLKRRKRLLINNKTYNLYNIIPFQETAPVNKLNRL